MAFRKAVYCVCLLELVSFSSEDSYQLLQVLLFASRDKEQPVLSLEVESALLLMACYLTVNLAVYFLKKYQHVLEISDGA